jgi:predicted phage terminase large subunit-like protein
MTRLATYLGDPGAISESVDQRLLTDRDRAVLAELARRRRGSLLTAEDKPSSPVAFARLASNLYESPPHIELLDRRLVECAEGKCRRLIITMPPRHGKSLLASQYFPAWFVGRYPDKRIILCSYEADFAATWGRKARQLLEEYGAEHFGVGVARESSAAYRWDIAGHTGGMVTAGVGGPITGRGANVLIIDDPVKNAEEAASERVRETLWDWYKSTAYTRLEPNASVILIMTRWHEDDLAGRVLVDADTGGDQWERIDFPAIATEEDTLGRLPGEALWPERYDTERLEEIKQTLGSYFWSALYQQRPQPEGGAIFRRSWFRYFRRADGFYVLSRADGRDELVAEEACWKFQTCDPAATEKEQNDWFACSTWAVTPKHDLLLLSVFRERADTTKHGDIMQTLYRRWGPVWQGVESKTFGLNIIQDARNLGLPIRALKADVDKVSRARNIAARYEAGKVFHELGSEWLDVYEREVLQFPTGKHDDQVDTASYAGVALTEAGPGYDPYLEQLSAQEQRPEDKIVLEADPNRAGGFY